MERILIRGLKLFGHHGVYAGERQRGQFFLVDAHIDLARPSRRDDLTQTVDYSAIIDALREENEGQQFRLIESLAHALAQSLLKRFSRIQRVRVRIRKRLPRSQAALSWVAAETVCARDDIRE